MPELPFAFTGCVAGHAPSVAGSTHARSSAATSPTAATGSSLTTGAASRGRGAGSAACGRSGSAGAASASLGAASVTRSPSAATGGSATSSGGHVAGGPRFVRASRLRLRLAQRVHAADEGAEVGQSLDPPQPLPYADGPERTRAADPSFGTGPIGPVPKDRTAGSQRCWRSSALSTALRPAVVMSGSMPMPQRVSPAPSPSGVATDST